MTPVQIILIAVLIVLAYLIYTYTISGSSNKLTDILPANKEYVVSSDKINSICGNNTSLYNYTISVWIYIDNWSSTTTTSTKNILVIGDDTNNGTPTMKIYLGNTDNTLSVDLNPSEPFTLMSALTPAPIESMASMNLTKKKSLTEGIQNINGDSFLEGVYQKVSSNSNVKKREGMAVREGLTSVVQSIPLQSWTNIVVNVNGKALDIYINGKLNQSSIVPSMPKSLSDKIVLTPNSGFTGWTSNFQLYPYNLSPKQIYNIYSSGYTGSPESILSLLGKYSMKIIFVDNTQTSK